MTDETNQDELKQMYDEGTDRVLDSSTFRVPLRDVPSKTAVTVSPDVTVREAAGLLKEARQGCVLVLEGGKLAGIFTERDALVRVIAGGLDPGTTRIRDVMTPQPETLSVLQTLRHAVHYMVSGGLRHIPLMDGDRTPELVISARDVLAFISEYFPEDVKNLPPRPKDFMKKYGG